MGLLYYPIHSMVYILDLILLMYSKYKNRWNYLIRNCRRTSRLGPWSFSALLSTAGKWRRRPNAPFWISTFSRGNTVTSPDESFVARVASLCKRFTGFMGRKRWRLDRKRADGAKYERAPFPQKRTLGSYYRFLYEDLTIFH